MALIICPECGKKISSRALACPACGLPREEFDKPVSETEPVQTKITIQERTFHVKCLVCGNEYDAKDSCKCPICLYPSLSFNNSVETVGKLINKARSVRGFGTGGINEEAEYKSLQEIREAILLKLRELNELCLQGSLIDETGYRNSSISEVKDALDPLQKPLLDEIDAAQKDSEEIMKYPFIREGKQLSIGRNGHLINRPVKWTVIARNGNDVLVMSSAIIDKDPYNKNETSEITWQDCSLRKILNGYYFYEYFSKKEKKAIKGTVIDNNVDKLFLLSKEELDAYPYAKNLESSWLLRDVIDGNKTVNNEGVIHECTEEDGIRPAMWIDLDELFSDIKL